MSKSKLLPRVVVAGLSGDSGKTLLSLGLLLTARHKGLAVQAFKKGPDYIDPAWLSWASGKGVRNLDTYLMAPQDILASFARHGADQDWSLVEGNRGLYDGVDARGTHSTAELAKLLQAPVILVINATKVTRTVAALVLGCRNLDPAVDIAGVVLNQLSGPRHEQVARDAVERTCGIPVLGALPRAEAGMLLPQRHLGLVTPHEHPQVSDLERNVSKLVRDHVDFDGIQDISHAVRPLDVSLRAGGDPPSGAGLRIGVLRDSAFNFYYPENLEVLETSGASLVPLSSLTDQPLPSDLDALYIGGGFPETHGSRIASNSGFLQSLSQEAHRGLPIYAECGGLMLLSRAIHWRGAAFRMAGVLPFDVAVGSRPEGHGYAELFVDNENPFFPRGTTIRGHEFHYSKILTEGIPPPTAGSLKRGTGSYGGRDGIVVKNVWASYLHLHALGTPAWTSGLLSAARSRRAAACGNDPLSN